MIDTSLGYLKPWWLLTKSYLLLSLASFHLGKYNVLLSSEHLQRLARRLGKENMSFSLPDRGGEKEIRLRGKESISWRNDHSPDYKNTGGWLCAFRAELDCVWSDSIYGLSIMCVCILWVKKTSTQHTQTPCTHIHTLPFPYAIPVQYTALQSMQIIFIQVCFLVCFYYLAILFPRHVYNPDNPGLSQCHSPQFTSGPHGTGLEIPTAAPQWAAYFKSPKYDSPWLASSPSPLWILGQGWEAALGWNPPQVSVFVKKHVSNTLSQTVFFHRYS